VSQPTIGTETEALLASLNAQRRHVLGILADLSDDDLRRAVLPSGWTCIGMVRHLTLDVERFWFRGVVAGQPIDLDISDDVIWNVRADQQVAAVLDDYRQEIEHADTIISATAPDAAPTWWPEELFPGFRLHTLRQIVLHVITETACHAGHLDAARELIDGRTWLVLTE
jgi:uncharacterized damage-inducible protein DinB